MKIVHDVLEACGYNTKEAFSFTYRWNDTEYCRLVYPYVSEQYPDDVYLLVSLQPEEFTHTLDNAFMSALAITFRKQLFHRSTMDRNTTLLLSCLFNATAQIDHDLRVQLEDDPYYFKKYVFSYTAEDEFAAEHYLEENRRTDESLIDTIRRCLLNTTLFAAYKEKIRDHKAYGYFAELATKVTVLPIRPDSGGTIETVEAIWRKELQKAPAINLNALESILELNAENPDEMLDKWRELTKTVGG